MMMAHGQSLDCLWRSAGLLWMAKIAYMTFALGIVVPLLLAVVIDLYIVLPIRFSLNPGMVPRIRIVDQWSLGLLYAKIGVYVQRVQPPNRISAGLQHVRFSSFFPSMRC
jgi:E3 ubiquitin-protein ligase MARCH6